MSKLTPNISQVEHFLAQQGSFSIIDWLLKENLLDFSQYEAWRYGKCRFLDNGLDLKAKEIETLISQVESICAKLGLSNQAQEYFSWAEDNSDVLRASASARVDSALTLQWMRPQDLPQMDLFLDNSSVIAENDALTALATRKYDAALEHLRRLTELNPNNEKLGKYQDLINYGQHMSVNSIDDANLSAELNALENEVLPLAQEVLKSNARDYLASAWRRLSGSLATKAFNPNQPKLHQSYVLMQLTDWTAALQSLEREDALFSTPLLLHRLARCFESLRRENEALYSWCLLMELDSDYCERVIEEKTSPLVTSLWEDFWEIDDASIAAFFPVFILAAQPGLLHHIKRMPPLTAPSSQAVIAAIEARASNSDEIPARKRMQDISPVVLRLYMAVR